MQKLLKNAPNGAMVTLGLQQMGRWSRRDCMRRGEGHVLTLLSLFRLLPFAGIGALDEPKEPRRLLFAIAAAEGECGNASRSKGDIATGQVGAKHFDLRVMAADDYGVSARLLNQIE
jgi:hypothetical protein